MIALFSPGSGALDSAAARVSFLLLFLLSPLISFNLGTTGAIVVVATEVVATDVGTVVALASVADGSAGAFAALALGKAVGELAAEMAVESVTGAGG